LHIQEYTSENLTEAWNLVFNAENIKRKFKKNIPLKKRTLDVISTIEDINKDEVRIEQGIEKNCVACENIRLRKKQDRILTMIEHCPK